MPAAIGGEDISDFMKVAIVQTCSDTDVGANLERARSGVLSAAQMGATLVALPENFAYMRREGGDFPCAQGPDGEIVHALREMAKETGVWLLGGSFPEAIDGERHVFNTSVLIAPSGAEAARYRKIHLFDVDLGSEGEDRYRESAGIAAGDEPVVAKTSFGPVGLSICYDLRFPELYRKLVERGARWITVPSAFTPRTGRDHWRVLLRARAIENQAFVIAPAQCGRHSPDRASYGRSLIVDPWGIVLAQGSDRPGILIAECEPEAVDRVRRAIPALSHRRLT